MKIASIPIDLLNEDLPSNDITLAKSHKTSGSSKSLLIRFLKTDINKVGKELLLVIS